MDELKIESVFTRGLICKIIRHVAKKKAGVDIGVDIIRLNVRIPDEGDKATMHIECDVDISKKDIIHYLVYSKLV